MEEEEHDSRVLGLLIPVFSGVKDGFGKETVPPLPLLLDRVGEGQLPRSKAPLFELPCGVLGEIVQFLDPESLAAFALVNWDCLQVARSRRFASVLLDYSDSTIALIAKLISEGEERSHSPNGTISKPSIGACIRRITVATNAGWVSHRHGITLRPDSERDDENAKRMERKRIADASRAFFDSYLVDLMTIFSSRQILPHLELLDWEDKIVLPRLFFESLACSSIKHLKLYRVMIDEEFTVKLPNMLASGGWPLQTLHLEIHWNVFGKRFEGDTSSVCSSILRLCAPTLVSLNWTSAIDRSLHSLIADSEGQLKFPRLRELRLGNILFSDSASLEALLGGNLVSLIANTEKNAIHEQCFQNRGTIRSLEIFVWETFQIPADHPLDFLRANPQLSKLSIPYPVPRVLIETRLLPLLSSSFKNLCSLALVWEGVQIPNSALRIISTIKSLQEIHLSAGYQLGWRHDWLIDHKSMRKYLRSLPDLKKVAFSRDSYDNGFEWSENSRYYVDKCYSWSEVVLVDGEDLASRDSRDAVWDRLHRDRMLSEATKYVNAFPKLEWLYFGQLPMSVTESQTTKGARHAVPLWAERDDCWTVLRKIFGGSVD